MDKDNYKLVDEKKPSWKMVAMAVGIILATFLIGFGCGAAVQKSKLPSEQPKENSVFSVSGNVFNCYGIHLGFRSGRSANYCVCPGAKFTQFAASVPTAIDFFLPSHECFASLIYNSTQTPSNLSIAIDAPSIADLAKNLSYKDCSTRENLQGIKLSSPVVISLDFASHNLKSGNSEAAISTAKLKNIIF